MTSPANPVLVELTRGERVESRHRGALAIVDVRGHGVLALGDVASPVYPRSAVKALQAAAMVESGAAHAFGLGEEELAVACASHSGEPVHVEMVRSLLAKARVPEEALACGAHWPLDAEAARALAARGESPRPIHNNCSGKHAAMLALAAHLRADFKGYQLPAHPAQQAVRATLEALYGEMLSEERCAVDGCSAPTWAVPLRALAHGMARFASDTGLGQVRAGACVRLRRACTLHPHLVAGTGRFCTRVMRALGARAFVKGGAEGVHCAALPQARLGIALKIDDGARRASEVAMAAVLAQFVPGARETIGDLARGRLHNWRGLDVGTIGPSPQFVAALADLNPGR